VGRNEGLSDMNVNEPSTTAHGQKEPYKKDCTDFIPNAGIRHDMTNPSRAHEQNSSNHPVLQPCLVVVFEGGADGPYRLVDGKDCTGKSRGERSEHISSN
jgi:hypothetical protein